MSILPNMIGKEFASVLERSRSGDESAFACLFQDINPTLRRYLSVIAGDVNEDALARTWEVLGRGLASFRGDEMAWRSWVFATARRAEPAAFAHQSVSFRESADAQAPGTRVRAAG